MNQSQPDECHTYNEPITKWRKDDEPMTEDLEQWINHSLMSDTFTINQSQSEERTMNQWLTTWNNELISLIVTHFRWTNHKVKKERWTNDWGLETMNQSAWEWHIFDEPITKWRTDDEPVTEDLEVWVKQWVNYSLMSDTFTMNQSQSEERMMNQWLRRNLEWHVHS